MSFISDARRPAHRRVPRRSTIVIPAAGPPRRRALRRWLGTALTAHAIAVLLAASLAGVHAIGRGAWYSLVVHLGAPARVWATALLRCAPVGYFIGFAQRGRRAPVIAALVGAAMSAALELGRALDGGELHVAASIAGAAGAAVGALAFVMVAARLRARAANEAALLAPELPLVGGAYLATPLLWLAASGAVQVDGEGAQWSVVLLGLYGASLLASARTSRGVAGGGPHVQAAVAAGWFGVGAAPLALVTPTLFALSTVVVAAFAALHPLSLGMDGRERRVELPALRRAMPLLALYLLVSAADPASTLAERLAAFSVVGYTLAELRARREERAAVAWRAVLPQAAACAVVVLVVRVATDATGGWGPSPEAALGATAVALAATSAAACLGASLYALQRAHARAHARVAGVTHGATERAAQAAGTGGYIRRSWPTHTPPFSTPGQCLEPSDAWRTRSWSSMRAPTD